MSSLLAGFTILIIDSEPMTQRVLIDILETSGAETVNFGQIQATLGVCKTFTPDCIFCNVNLFDGSGYKLVRQLRQLEGDLGVTPTPAIAIFDSDRTVNTQTTQFALQVGFQAIVTQPLRFEEIINVVLRVMGRS